MNQCNGSACSSGCSTRRGFLQQSGGAVALFALTTQRSWAVNTAPKKVRIGIVGGGFGRGFYFHEHPDCIVEAVSDLRPERRKGLMEIYRCSKSYESLEKLVLDPNIDAVAIFTDGPLHLQHTIEAMKHGKHVMVAVPAVWGSLEQADELLATVKRYDLLYMMAETGYYQQQTISARKFYQEGQFGDIFYCKSEYLHDGLEKLYFENGKRTWRHGMAPMHYPTHNTVHLVGITGERLTEVTCLGWGDGDPILKHNVYKNPFWNESATFKTDRDHTLHVNVWWKGPIGHGSLQWNGDKMGFFPDRETSIYRPANQTTVDDAGFEIARPAQERYQIPDWWATEMLPQPLRHGKGGHEGSHPFLTHEFVDAVVHNRQPAIDVYESLAYTVPGIVAHESALHGGERMKIPQYDPASRG